MIERFFVKDFLSFQEAKLFFEPGLVVFTGPSGSGKSILLNALLGVLAQSQSEASMAELEYSKRINLDEYGIESDDTTIFKQLKKGNTRFFINNQSITKKMMSEVSGSFIKHLSHKDFSDFEQDHMVAIIDEKVKQTNTTYTNLLKEYSENFTRFTLAKKELHALLDEEQRLVELREYAQFELDKIDAINPQIDEDVALEKIKKQLSKKEKLQEQIQEAMSLFEFEHKVVQALQSLDVDSAFFDDAMNEVRGHFDGADALIEELEDLDIEAILDRIEAIGELKRRYGSIEEAMQYKALKQKELDKYDNFDVQKQKLQDEVDTLQEKVTQQADAIHIARLQVLPLLEERLNFFVKSLYLREATLELMPQSMTKSGVDKVEIALKGASLQQISSGEFNRLRLAMLAVQSEIDTQKGGVLILDEIDANLSGEESMSVARVLTQLSKNYQIFAISHQPQLTSQAKQHFFVFKEDETSCVKMLETQERITEIARMISGDKITNEAKEFAIRLLKENRCA